MARVSKISDDQIIELIEQGLINAEIARRLGVTMGSISVRCVQLRKRHAPLDEKPHGVKPNYEVLKSDDRLSRDGKLFVVSTITPQGITLRHGENVRGMSRQEFEKLTWDESLVEWTVKSDSINMPAPTASETVISIKMPEINVDELDENLKQTKRIEPAKRIDPIEGRIMENARKKVAEHQKDRARLLEALEDGQQLPSEIVLSYNARVFETVMGDTEYED